MYVCLCRGITDHKIIEAVQQGARCNRDLNLFVGTKPDCGECGSQTRQIIKDTCADMRFEALAV